MNYAGFESLVGEEVLVPTVRREFTPADTKTSVTPKGGSSLVDETGSLNALA